MKRYFGFLVIGLAFLFAINASPFSGETVASTPASAKMDRWVRSESKNGSTFYRLEKKSENEDIACVISPHFTGITYVDVTHLQQKTDGAWSSANETITIEWDGIINKRYEEHSNDYASPPTGVYFLNGSFSPFFTFCASVSNGLPGDLVALLAKSKL